MYDSCHQNKSHQKIKLFHLFLIKIVCWLLIDLYCILLIRCEMVWNRVRWFKLFSQTFILKPILSHFFIPIRDFSNFGCKVTTIRYKHISILKHNIVDFVTLLYRIFSILFHNMQNTLFFSEFIGIYSKVSVKLIFIKTNKISEKFDKKWSKLIEKLHSRWNFFVVTQKERK